MVNFQNIFYLYSFDTGELLYLSTDKNDFDKVWEVFEKNGVDCWSEDLTSKIHNIKIEKESK